MPEARTTLTLPDDAQLFIVDDKGVVFRQGNQQLYSLNSFATFIWCCLEEEACLERAAGRARETFGISDDVAQQWVDDAVEGWGAIGLIGDCVASAPVDPLSVTRLTCVDQAPAFSERDWQCRLSYRLLDCRVDVMLQNAAWAEPVEAILGHLAVPGDAAAPGSGNIHVCLHDGWVVVYRNRLPVARFENVGSIAPTVKSITLQEAVDNFDYAFSFHSGVLSNGDGLVMLSGAAGAGKSTLTAGLVNGGLCYYSDEVALVQVKDYCVRPFPIALCSKEPAWPVLQPLFPTLADMPAFERLDKKQVRYFPPPVLPQDPDYDRALPIKVIVFPRYDNNANTELLPIDRVAALHHLMEECLSIKHPLDIAAVGEMVEWIRGVECYELPNNNLQQAVDLVLGVMA